MALSRAGLRGTVATGKANKMRKKATYLIVKVGAGETKEQKLSIWQKVR
jgi:hypothetical protein